MPAWSDIWYWVLKALAVLAIPLMVFSAVMMIRTVGKEQRVKLAPVVLQAVSPFIVLGVYAYFLKLEPPQWLSILLLVVGVALGVVWSRSVRMRVQGRAVISKRSVLYVVLWALTLVVTQTLAVFTNTEFAAYAYSTMYFSAGVAAGLNIAMLLRGTTLVRAQVAVAGGPSVPRRPPPPPPEPKE